MNPAHKNSMSIQDAGRLRQAWAATGNQDCRHRHFAVESTALGHATGFYICKRCGARKRYGEIPMTKRRNENRRAPLRLTVALLSGALVGAVLTGLITPEKGSAVRQRLSRGARTLRTDVTQLMSDSREAYSGLAKDTRQTFRQTAARLIRIMSTCMKA
jgi:hypothetical protein